MRNVRGHHRTRQKSPLANKELEPVSIESGRAISSTSKASEYLPQHEISNNVVYCKASDQPVQAQSDQSLC